MVNTSTRPDRRDITAAWAKRARPRAYGSMLPDTSRSSTSRRGRSTGDRHDRRIGTPPVRMLRRTVARRSGWPRPAAATAGCRRDGRSSDATPSAEMSRWASAHSAGVRADRSCWRSTSTAE